VVSGDISNFQGAVVVVAVVVDEKAEGVFKDTNELDEDGIVPS